MKLHKVLAVSGLAVLLSGCDLFARPHSEKPAIATSNHTIQELCDSAKPFFVSRAGTTNLDISRGVGGQTMTDKIDGGNGCFYNNPAPSAWPSYLGSVSLFLISDVTLGPTPSSTADYLTEALTVDGVTVKAATEPLPKWGDPATTLLDVDLTASIDGWKGELFFKGTEKETARDDQTTRAAAQALVNMIRTLKG